MGFIISIRMNKTYSNEYGSNLKNYCTWFFLLNIVDAAVGIFFMLYVYKLV